MTTKVRRGRDPEQHLVHENPTAADSFIGLLGEITLVRDAAGIVQLRAHDGNTKGGALSALAEPSPVAALPNRKAVPAIAATAAAGVALTIHHELGYAPMVQVLDAAGVQLFPTVVHDDLENVSLVFASDADVTVVLA